MSETSNGPQFKLLSPSHQGPSNTVVGCVALFLLAFGWIPIFFVDSIWEAAGSDRLLLFGLGWLLVTIPCTLAAGVLVSWTLLRLLLRKLG